MPPKTKLVKGKSGAFGLTSDGVHVDVLAPDARLVQGKSGAWGITLDGKSVDVLADFDESTLDSTILWKAPTEKKNPSPSEYSASSSDSLSNTADIETTPQQVGSVVGEVAAKANQEQYEAVADYQNRSLNIQPFEKILKNFPDLNQQWQESKLAFQPTADENGEVAPVAGGKAFLKNLGESQDRFIEQFASKLRGQHDPKTNTYVDADGKPIDPNTYKSGDILAIRNGMLYNDKPLKADFVQLVEGADGKKAWVSFSKDQIANPNFNQKDEDLLDDVIVSSPAFVPKEKPVNAGDLTTEESNWYNQSLVNKEADPVLKEAYALNQNYGVGDKQITVLPRFFKMHPEIKDAYKQEFEANPGKHASIGGQREMIDASIVKTHTLDKSIFDLTGEYADVDRLELLTNLETLNGKGDVERRNLAIQRMQNLKQRALGIQTVLQKTTDKNKQEYLQSELQKLGEEYNQLITDHKPELEAYQKAREYFDNPELKWFKDTLAKQNKGRLLLTQTKFLFPKSEEKEAVRLAEDESPDSAPLYIFKKFGGAVADILTNTVQFLGQAADAISVLPQSDQQRRAEQAYFSDVSDRKANYWYSSEEGRNEATKVAGGVSSMLPYFLPGGIAGKTGRVLMNASFLLPEYVNAQREAQAQGLDGSGANLYAALQTVPTAIALNMFHLKPSTAALPGKIGMETFNKIISPSLRKEGLKDLSSMFTKEMLTGAGNGIAPVLPVVR